jgi:hypothetical protein
MRPRAITLLCRLLLPLVVVILGHAGGALAYFSATGAGTAPATVATITGPSGVTVVQSGTSITISWSAATLSTGAAVQGYTVKRSDEVTVCGSPTLVTSLSCTDTSVPTGTYTYSVTAVYQSWDSAASSGSFTVLTAPTITSSPPAASNSSTASFSFTGGNGSSYKCQLDGGPYATCTSPAAYSGLAEGSHTFKLYAAQGSSTGPVTTYSWSVDTTPPSQSLALAGGPSGAYLTGSILYYKGNAAGSFKLVDTVSDSGSGPASASFPTIPTAGWSHAAETVSTPSGGPYTSSTFSWSAGAASPGSYTVTGADAAGNTASSSLTLVNDSTVPTGGAVTVNGTAATSGAGSTSQATNSTSFTISNRTDYTDSGSGLKSSILTVQSETLSGSTCGSPGSGGPFTSSTTISGTTQPSGILAGYCYVYTLTGTDDVGNVAQVSTTVIDNALSFKVTTQPTSVTAGVATASNAVVVTAIKNSTTDTSYTGSVLTWSGSSNSPSGTAPTLPTNPTWTSGQATFGITLVKAESETLSVTDGTRSATFSPITVNPGSASRVAWASPSSPAGLPSPCLFTCAYSSGFGFNQTWNAYVSITDSVGNVVSNLGAGHTVVVTLGGGAKGSTTPASPATFTIPTSGSAQSATQLQYKSPASGSYTDTLTATSVGYSGATASFSK